MPLVTRKSNNKLTKTETETHTLLVEVLNAILLQPSLPHDQVHV